MARKTTTRKKTTKTHTPIIPKTTKTEVSAVTSEPVKTVPTTTDAAPVETPDATVVTELRKKEFIEKVAEAAGQKKGIAKKVIEATLRELGDAIQRGDAVNLPPLGKMMVNREKDVGGANIYITKLRRSKAMLADDAASQVEDANDADDAAQTAQSADS